MLSLLLTAKSISTWLASTVVSAVSEVEPGARWSAGDLLHFALVVEIHQKIVGGSIAVCVGVVIDAVSFGVHLSDDAADCRRPILTAE